MVVSGASLHMMSKNELTSDEQNTIRRSTEPTVTTANGEARVNGRSGSVCHRFGRCCHNDVVRRFSSGALFGFIVEEMTTPVNGKGESLHHR